MLAMRPIDMFDYAYGASRVICPICGFEYTHIIGIGTRLGSDPFEAGATPYFGSPWIGITEDRRSALVIMFWCEEHHRFALTIQQHKGQNYCTVDRLRDVSYGQDNRDLAFEADLQTGRALAEERLRDHDLIRKKEFGVLSEVPPITNPITERSQMR